MLNPNVYEELINTGGHCMVLERIILTDSGDIYYCALSDEYFTVNTCSVSDDRMGSDTQVFIWPLSRLEGTKYLFPENDIASKQMQLAGLHMIFHQMASNWIKEYKQ